MRPSNRSRALSVLIGALTVLACSSSSPSKGNFPPQASSDATLASLTISAGSLAPAFSDETLGYTAALPNGTTTFTVTPTAASPVAKSIMVQQGTGAFYSVTSGTPSMGLDAPAVQETTRVVVRVTAEDGITIREYTIDVTQEALVVPGAFTIYMIGDSTMADYSDEVKYPNRQGWGHMFTQFLSPNVTLVNAAINGRSSKSYYVEGSWESRVRSKLKAGDYVFIQFGHNDEKMKGAEGSETPVDETTDPDELWKGTAPFGGFQRYLRTYIEETRAAGATPILITPVVRLGFSGDSLKPVSYHDYSIADNPATADVNEAVNRNYVEAMKQVAAEPTTPPPVELIDMTASTKALVESLGAVVAKRLVYVDDRVNADGTITEDNTHLKPLGATMFAQLAAKEMKEKGILADYISNPAADLIVSPSTLAFGQQFVGTARDQVLTLTGLSLGPADGSGNGSVTVTSSAGFKVGSTSNGTFSDTLDIPYSNGTLAPTKVWVRFEPTATGDYSSGVVTVQPATGSAKTVPVSGVALAQPAGNEVLVTYPLTYPLTDPLVDPSAGPPNTPNMACSAPGGLANCADERLQGLVAGWYDSRTLKDNALVVTWNGQGAWSETISTSPWVQRVNTTGSALVKGEEKQNAWPANITAPYDDPASTERYVEFAVSPVAGYSWSVDRISFFAGAYGGSDFHYEVRYSTEAGFGNYVVLLPGSLANTKGAMMYHELTEFSGSASIVIQPGQTLYLRVYPWNQYSDGATGKFLMMQDVAFHGYAEKVQ